MSINPAKWVAKAVSQDETRESLCVVWRQDKIRWATDGHRLHLAPEPDQHIMGGESYCSEPPSAAYPAPYRQAIPDEDGVRLDLAATRILRKLVAMADAAGPKRQRREVVLVTATEPARLIVIARKESTDPVEIAVAKKLKKTTTMDGAIMGAVPLADGEFWSKAGTRVCLNVAYLIDALAGTGAARILLGDGTSPVKITHDDGRIAVIMPMLMLM